MDPAAVPGLACPGRPSTRSFTGIALETRVSPHGAGARQAAGRPRCSTSCAALAWRTDLALDRRPLDRHGNLVLARAAADAALDRQRTAGSDGRLVWVLAPALPSSSCCRRRSRSSARGPSRFRRTRRLRAEGSLRARPAPQARALLPAPPQRRHPQPQPLGRHDPVAGDRAAAAGAHRCRDVDRAHRRHAARGAADGARRRRLRARSAWPRPRRCATRRSRSSRRSRASQPRPTGTSSRTARAARAIRLFGKEQVRAAVWRNKFVELTNLGLASGRLAMFSGQAAQLTNGLGNVALIAIGTWLVLGNDHARHDDDVLPVSRLPVERLNRAVTYAMELRLVRTNAERIEDVCSTTPAPARRRARAVLAGDGDGVAHRGPRRVVPLRQRQPWILKGASLTIEPGESVAITGRRAAARRRCSSSCSAARADLGPGAGQRPRPEDDGLGATYRTRSASSCRTTILFHGSSPRTSLLRLADPIRTHRPQRARKATVAADVQAMPMQYTRSSADMDTRLLRRPEAAPFHRPRAVPRAAHPLPRRGDEPSRRRSERSSRAPSRRWR